MGPHMVPPINKHHSWHYFTPLQFRLLHWNHKTAFQLYIWIQKVMRKWKPYTKRLRVFLCGLCFTKTFSRNGTLPLRLFWAADPPCGTLLRVISYTSEKWHKLNKKWNYIQTKTSPASVACLTLELVPWGLSQYKEVILPVWGFPL